VRDNSWLRRTKHDTAQDIVATWETISAETLAAGWEIYKKESLEDCPELLYTIESINPSNKSLIQ
jgi:hypothetical protein